MDDTTAGATRPESDKKYTIECLLNGISEAKAILGQGKSLQDALNYCDRAIELAKGRLGGMDRHIIDAKEERALIQKRIYPASAVEEFEVLLEKRRQVNGAKHPQTLKTQLRHAHALWEYDVGSERASSLMLEVIEQHAFLLCSEEDMKVLVNMGKNLKTREKFDEAALMFRRVLYLAEAKENSFHTIEARRRLAETLYDQAMIHRQHVGTLDWRGRISEARDLAHENLKILKDKLGNAEAANQLARTPSEAILLKCEAELQKNGFITKSELTPLDGNSQLKHNMSSTILVRSEAAFPHSDPNVQTPAGDQMRRCASSPDCSKHVGQQQSKLSKSEDLLRPDSLSHQRLRPLTPTIRHPSPVDDNSKSTSDGVVGRQQDQHHEQDDQDIVLEPYSGKLNVDLGLAVLTGTQFDTDPGAAHQPTLSLERQRRRADLGWDFDASKVAEGSHHRRSIDRETVSSQSTGLEMRHHLSTTGSQARPRNMSDASDFIGDGVRRGAKLMKGIRKEVSQVFLNLKPKSPGSDAKSPLTSSPVSQTFPSQVSRKPVSPDLMRTPTQEFTERSSPRPSTPSDRTYPFYQSLFPASQKTKGQIWFDSSENGMYREISEEEKKADDWFQDLERTHRLLRSTPAPSDEPRVKICILDTGIDGKHPFLLPTPFGKGWGDRLKGYICFDEKGQKRVEKAWTSWAKKKTGDNVSGYTDSDGHGTHCAGLILQVAPWADLYVARVGIGRNNPPDPHCVKEAIEHAVNDWGVDIISMSWGFKDTPKPISDAIRDYSSKTIMFAAAANHGGKEPHIAFPANSGNVICIKASNGLGNAIDYSPKTIDGAGDNFFILGKDVLSMWPAQTIPPVNPNGILVLQKRATGTSVATPIAAAVAALVLEFTRQVDVKDTKFLANSRKTIEQIGLREAMSRILRALSSKGDDPAYGVCRIINPWRVLEEDDSEEDPRRGPAKKIYDSLQH